MRAKKNKRMQILKHDRFDFSYLCAYMLINLFVTSKNETTNSPIHEFKVLHKGQSLLNPLFNGVLIISYLHITLKNILSLAFTFCSTLNS